MATLFSYFCDVFSTGLEVDEALSCGKETRSALEVNEQLSRRVKAARERALIAGKREQDVSEAAFAVIAWLDELVGRHHDTWVAATPLQVGAFSTSNAGNEFFSHLERLTTEQDEVREMYYLALCLGFQGQYFYETGDGGDLGRLKDLHSRQLPVRPAPVHTLREEKITPQPYSLNDPAGIRLPGSPERMLLWAALAFALLLPLGYLIHFLMTPPPPEVDLQQQVNHVLAGFRCAELSGRVDENNGATVSGFVSQPDDVARLKGEMAKLQALKEVKTDVSVRIWPYCEVVALLKPYKQRNEANQFGLEIQPTTGHSDAFVEGEQVTVHLRQPGYNGYLYVDYYVIDGTVIHLFPNRREPESGHVIEARNAIRVGEHIDPPWLIGPPFGQELITVISSPVPLYEGELPETEPASVYLPRLHQLMEANQQEPRLTASFLFLQTQPAHQEARR